MPGGRPSDFTPEIANIYGITDPDTGEVRYIGKACDAGRRMRGHLRECRRRTPLYDWIKAKRAEGKTPGCVVLVADSGDWRADEKRLIAEARARGDRILNVADGGDEPKCPPEVRAANGRATSAAIRADPKKRRIWEIKRAIGALLRDGFGSNAARAKLRLAAAKAPHIFGAYASLPDREEGADGSPIQGYRRLA